MSRNAGHHFSKDNVPTIRLLCGLGVECDGHAGVTVQHRSRVRKDPSQPNLRQVHLIHSELHDELRDRGYAVQAGQLGENITTRGISLLDLPKGCLLHIGPAAVVEVTGLRNPCYQIDHFQRGVLAAVLDRDPAGSVVRKSGVMAVVLGGGDVRRGDAIDVEMPPGPWLPLQPV
ncbi:MAG: MOSC domain-containing protein [Nocardioidaceae bacterium]